MRRAIRILGMLLLALVVASPGWAVSLSDLFAGATLTVGDKVFDNWELIGKGLDDTTGNVDLANIVVTGIEDPLNPGLRFDANGELQLSGDNYIDLYFGYRVSVTDPAMLIEDVSFLFLQGSFGGDGFHAAYEDVLDSTGASLGMIGLEASNLNFVTSGSVAFAPQTEIWVQKNILLYGYADGDSTGLESFTQRFSQTSAVPEPSTMLLLASGLLGLVGLNRRRKA